MQKLTNNTKWGFYSAMFILTYQGWGVYHKTISKSTEPLKREQEVTLGSSAGAPGTILTGGIYQTPAAGSGPRITATRQTCAVQV